MVRNLSLQLNRKADVHDIYPALLGGTAYMDCSKAWIGGLQACHGVISRPGCQQAMYTLRPIKVIAYARIGLLIVRQTWPV